MCMYVERVCAPHPRPWLSAASSSMTPSQ